MSSRQRTFSGDILFPNEMYNQWSFKILATLGAIIHIILIDLPKDLWRWITLTQKNVRGQVTVITGAGSGLGRRMAEILALDHGAKVVAIDVNEKGLKETTDIITKEGGLVKWWKCDISNDEEMRRVAGEIEKEYGKVDIVVCNAAVLAFKFFMDLTNEEIKRSFDVNVIGTINTIRAFLGAMEARNEGHIVSVSSIAGFIGETYGLAYCPSKFAVRGLMETLQMELRDMGLEGIKVTTLCPYFARTPMVLDNGLRPTCTWIPFMSTDSCATRMVDAILKEKVLAFMPSYVTMIPLVKGLCSNSIMKTLRKYLGVKYEPSESSSTRTVLSIPKDFFRIPHFFWWIVVVGGLTINFLAMAKPDLLNHVPLCGDILANIGKTFPVLVILTNIFALLSHLAEAIVAMLICDKLRVSFACTFKWFLQTFVLGYPSLSILLNYSKKQNTEDTETTKRRLSSSCEVIP